MASSTVSGPSPAPATLEILDRQVIESDGNYNAIPNVIKTPKGDWLLTYSKGQYHVLTPYIILRRSSDEGQTWSAEQQIFDTSTPDPILFLFPDSRIMMTLDKMDQNSVVGSAFTFSSDSGITWTPFTFFGSPTNQISAAGPIPYFDGGWYATAFGPNGDGTFNPYLLRSTDNGASWPIFSTVRQPGEPGMNETTIIPVGPRLFAISRSDAVNATYAHFSDDGGATWGAAIDYTPQVGVIQGPALLQTSQALFLFGRHVTASAPWEFAVFVSYDSGLTFGPEVLLDTYTGDEIDGGYCSVLQKANGDLFVTYYADSHNLRQPDIKSLVLHWDQSSPN